MTTRLGDIIGSVRTAATSDDDAIEQRVAARPPSGVHALDVERLQALVDQFGKLRRQRRLLDVVLALEQIHGIRLAVGDLLPDVGGSSCGHDQ